MQIKDKVSVVTGAASGIGRATALELVAQHMQPYALVSGDGGHDNGSFNLNSATGALTVRAGADLDFELTPVKSIRVSTTDSGKNVLEKMFALRRDFWRMEGCLICFVQDISDIWIKPSIPSSISTNAP